MFSLIVLKVIGSLLVGLVLFVFLAFKRRKPAVAEKTENAYQQVDPFAQQQQLPIQSNKSKVQNLFTFDARTFRDIGISLATVTLLLLVFFIPFNAVTTELASKYSQFMPTELLA